MGTGMDWLGHLAEWLARWVPRLTVVCDNQALLLFVRGTSRVVQGRIDKNGRRRGKLVLWWPIWSECWSYYTSEQIVSLTPQMLMTDDGRSVAVQAIMAFRILDVMAFGQAVFEAEESIAEAAGEAVRRVVVSTPLDKLQSGRADIDHKLTAAAQKATERFGVEVTKLRITSLAPARILGVFLSNFAPDRAQGGRAG